MKLKVYTWQGYHPKAPDAGNQVRFVMLAKSKAEVRRLTGFTEADLFNFGETGNRPTIEKALALEPRVLRWQPLNEFDAELRAYGVDV